MAIQEMDWGHIEWIHIKDEGNPKQNMNIGIVVILPGKHLVEHIHYGQEQLLYILEGEGIYKINNKESKSRPGQLFYMEAGSAHEMYNKTDKPIRELLISNPVYGAKELSLSEFRKAESDQNNILYASVESVRRQLIDPLKLPLTIYDTHWNKVLQTPFFQTYCIKKCNPIANRECECMLKRNFGATENYHQFVCPYGLTIYHQPIIYETQCIGVIRGGYILLSGNKGTDKTTDRTEEIYDTPESTALSIRRLLKKITEHIVSYCVFDDARKELEIKEEDINKAIKHGEELEENLNVTRNIVTDLKINHHFLFNTLNCMAGMALDESSYELYDAIIDLSKMFRYTMRVQHSSVAFTKEMAYVKTYLNLQKLRYEDTLQVDLHISKDLDEVRVPFNFLQPIIENAFTHGFDKRSVIKRISISAKPSAENMLISIYNNGSIIDYVTLNRLNKSVKTNNGHGLSLIYSKLEAAYSNAFSMKIYSNERIGTWITLEIPTQC